jgi:hypothetical protein
MELTPYLDGLRRDLAASAAPGGPDLARAAELLAGSIDASLRLCLLEALSDAAAEITTKLDRTGVEVRLHGREAQFVVTHLDPVEPAPAPYGAGTAAGAATTVPTAEGDLTRITLRLPESLKETVERAAAAEGVSVNAWLVRAIAQTVSRPSGPPSPMPPIGRRFGRHITGYADA